MEFASRTRETFIEMAPGETKTWRLPPCSEGQFNIWVKGIAGPGPIGGGGGGGHSGGGGGGGGFGGGIARVTSHLPEVVRAAGATGTIARYRSPFGAGIDPRHLGGLVVVDGGFDGGGGEGPATGLTVDLIHGATVAQSDANHIFMATTNIGDVWTLRIARRPDGSTDTRRYKVEVTYPSVLPVETRRIPASFFTRGFQQNWTDTPYLDYVSITSNKLAYRWNPRFAEMYGKPIGDQYISISDMVIIPNLTMKPIELSVGAETAPWPWPAGNTPPTVPFLKVRLAGRFAGSSTVELDTPGPNLVKVELPKDVWVDLKFFLGTEGSGQLAYTPVVESPLLDAVDRNVSYPTPAGMKTVNFKTLAKDAIESKLYQLQRSTDGKVTNIVDKYVRPYIVGHYELLGLQWDAARHEILAKYVGKQKPPAPHTVVVGGHRISLDAMAELSVVRAGDGPAVEPPPRLFETDEDTPPKPVVQRTVDVTPGNLSKIEHIVVLMQENRSFDHVLGYLSRDGILPRGGHESDGRKLQPQVEGLLPGTNTRDVNVYKNHEYHSARASTTGWPSYSLPGPYHGATAVAAQVSDQMKHFVSDWVSHIGDGSSVEERQLVMNYVTDVELPTYGALTREFAICDHWHCSHLGGTLPNRFISLTGDFSRDSYDAPEVQNPDLLGFSPLEQPTFFDHLTAHNVPWKLFEHGYSMLRLCRNFTFDETNIASFATDFEAAVAAGLPPVTFIEPDYIETPTGISNDDHAPADMMNGQILIARIMKALLANRAQWAKTLFIITYDEHGGFYDHLLPPTHDGQTPIPPLSTGEPRLGVRVPAFVISPWIPGSDAQGNVNVSHTIFDHTTIPATILRRFCGPKAPFMGDRWAAAHDVGPLLSLAAPRPDAEFDALRQDMAAISTRVATRITGDIPKPPLRRPQTAVELEEQFSGLLAFASSISGRGR